MTRKQHDAASGGDNGGVNGGDRIPPIDQLSPWLELPASPRGGQEQAALLQTAGMLMPALTHELSNPLCGVRNVLERMARKMAEDNAERHLLRLALDQCDQMRLLLCELQQFVSPASPEQAVFTLDQTLESVLRLVSKHLRIWGCGVEFVRPSQPLLLLGEEGRIRLLLVHLLLHCCRTALDEGCHLHIQAGIEGRWTQLMLRWQTAPGESENLRSALGGGAGTPWFNAILRQHGGELQVQQRADGLMQLILSFPLPHEEFR